jgi:hypothetical protein
MPVLSFPCVITRHDGPAERSRRKTWIKGHDLRALALAATDQLALTPDECEYKLSAPAIGSRAPGSAGIFLEVLHARLSAVVGPMGGPTPPSTFAADRAYALEDLLSGVGLGAEIDDTHARAYPVLVTYAGLFRDMAYPPPRQAKESDEQYATRCATAERVRVERGRYEGIHVIHYEVPPKEWKARDLEGLMGLAYRLLPTMEPRWRDGGAITQEMFATGRGGRTPTLHYSLEVARGDYAAYVRLPLFPMHALAEWLMYRRCAITLCHPLVKLEATAQAAVTNARSLTP